MVTSVVEARSGTAAPVRFATERDEWVMYANCRDCDPDALFVRGAAQRQAAAICDDCPVLLTCRADALDNKVEFGVWGGLTERQRRAILRRHPEIVSWREFFEQGGEVTIS